MVRLHWTIHKSGVRTLCDGRVLAVCHDAMEIGKEEVEMEVKLVRRVSCHVQTRR